jgi:hypothetical protein
MKNARRTMNDRYTAVNEIEQTPVGLQPEVIDCARKCVIG